MKQKIQILGVIFLAFILLFPVFLLSTENTHAASGCTISIETMELQPTAVTWESTTKLHAVIKKSGDFQNCSKVDNANIQLRFKIGSGLFTTEKSPRTKRINFSSDNKIVLDGNQDSFWGLKLDEMGSWGQYGNPNTMSYYLWLETDELDQVDNKSWGKTLTIAGPTSGATGNLSSVFVNFNQAQAKIGASLGLKLRADNISSLPAKIAVLVYVNNKLAINYYGPDQQGINRELLTTEFDMVLPVTTQNGFNTSGNNTIRVDIQQAGSPYALAGRGTGTIQTETNSNLPKVTINPIKNSYAMGDNVTLLFTNFPDEFIGSYSINNSEILKPISNLSVPVNLSVTQGFKDNFENNIKIFIQDSASKNVDVVGSPVIVKIGSIAPTNSTGSNPSPSTPINPGTDRLKNPLPVDNLTDTFLNIAKGFLAIIAIWAVMFVMVGGFRMVMSQGNEEAYGAAKKTVTWAILGLVVALLSFSIIAIVQNILGVDLDEFKPANTNPSAYIETTNKNL